MKKYLLIVAIITLCNLTIFAKTITVSNNPNSPGQYKRLDSAILAASPGDILLVSGSPTDYATQSGVGGTITINIPLTIYGAGYDPTNDQPQATTISTIYIAPGGSGSIISGISITSSLTSGVGTNNIVVSRCYIQYFGGIDNAANGVNGNNYDIQDNIIEILAINGNIGNIIIQNNIITDYIFNFSTDNNIIVNNNLFTTSQPLSLYNADVYNNIFYYKSTSATASAYVVGGTSNCVFNNNIYYNTTNSNPFNIGLNTNSGSNNINANPDFVNINLTGTGVFLTGASVDNFNLQPGSPGIGKGTDGKDIGPEGGSIPIQYPYSGEPAIPQMDSMSILNPVVSPNGTLNVKFAAHSNN